MTVNYGLRYDRFDANFDDEDQVSPRLNVVWKIDDTTTAHAGYARYFVPPPVQDLTLADDQPLQRHHQRPGQPRRRRRRGSSAPTITTSALPAVTQLLRSASTGSTSRRKQLVDLGQFGIGPHPLPLQLPGAAPSTVRSSAHSTSRAASPASPTSRG